VGHIINTLLYIFIGTVHIVIGMDKHNNKYAHNNKYILITEMSVKYVMYFREQCGALMIENCSASRHSRQAVRQNLLDLQVYKLIIVPINSQILPFYLHLL
jgi:hypothetical protein